MASPISIAIIGGGLAGAILVNSLKKIPHIDVQVYESAPEFSERGLGIGLSKLALQALEEIIPSATDLLRTEAGAVDIGASRIVIGSGPKAGALVCDIEGDAGLAMTRGPLLKTLLSLIPNNILHAAKKLASIEQTGSGVNITFEDGTAAAFDAVIGADGIFSTVRKHVLQGVKEHDASPVGGWECRNLVPIAKAKAVLGEKSFEIDREYCWAGDGGFMMHAVVEDGTMVQCIVACVETDFPPDRKRPVTREVLENALAASWFDGPIGKQMAEIMLDQENPVGYSIWEHKTTLTYFRGRVCLIGDAAHTTSPYQGAGGGLAIEDAFILGHLLSSITSAEDIQAVFKAFDAVRRPRCQAVIDTSRATGHLLSGQNPYVGVDAESMAKEMDVLFAHIDALDPNAHKKAALNELRKQLIH